MEFQGSWEEHLALAEFTYNNSYQSSIGMAPFEALYGRKCRSPSCWTEVGEAEIIGPDIVLETTEKIKMIQDRLKVAQDRQKSYADANRRELEFQEGDWVFLKVSPMKGVVRKYVTDPTHVLEQSPMELERNLQYEERPVRIMDSRDKQLRSKRISLIKVWWENQTTGEATLRKGERYTAKIPVPV
ncbi:uncharacterized protein LOC130754761 [Actinidia eriantha]|uniref:uncharacterized protein LOC130754761 n=1 Tax=Actinidia eriantha TaxID=165200 RepID=UPI00258F3C6D|nr:uncharacterized protein LOC130754761 [Actinidia eriantha]